LGSTPRRTTLRRDEHDVLGLGNRWDCAPASAQVLADAKLSLIQGTIGPASGEHERGPPARQRITFVGVALILIVA
jgi:hypothetical protein